jgi:hypothetical protein
MRAAALGLWQSTRQTLRLALIRGGQQLALFNAHYDSRCFPPIRRRMGPEVALVLRYVIGHIRARWPAVEIVVRGIKPSRPARGDGAVRAPTHWLHLRTGGQPSAAAACRPARPRTPLRAVSPARQKRSAVTGISATPRKAGPSSAASSAPISKGSRQARGFSASQAQSRGPDGRILPQIPHAAWQIGGFIGAAVVAGARA